MTFSAILLLEDSPLDAELAMERLCHGGIECEIHRVSTREEFIKAIESKTYDAILADFDLPGFDGLSALRIARDRAPETPFIFVSGKLGEENAVDSLRLGATDYVLKQRIERLVPAVLRAVAEARERVERRKAEKAAWENEHRLRQAVAIAKLGTFEIDLKTDAVQVNEPGRAIYGWSPEEPITFAMVQTFFHPEDRDEVVRRVQAALDPFGPGDFEVEQRIIRRDGVTRWIRVRGRAMFEGDMAGDGTASRLAGAYIDITDQKTLEQSLRDSERHFRETADTAPAVLWVTTAEASCSFVSRGWGEFTGQSLQQAQGLGWLDAFHPDDVERCKQSFLDAHARREPFELDCRVRRPDGSYRWVVDAGRPRFGTDGQFLGHVGSVIDVDDRKRAEAVMAGEKQVFEQIASGKPLHDVLHTIVRCIEAQSTDSLLCSVLLASDDGTTLVHGAAPSLPDAYCRAIDGMPIAPVTGCCGTAAYERRAITVTDTSIDPTWTNYRDIAIQHGLRACYVVPIFSSQGSVLGTVAIYYRRNHAPGEHDRRLVESAAYLAGIAIERKRAERIVREALEAEQHARATAERESRVKDEFLATLSHELRTPLNAILGWTQLIGRGRMTEEDAQEGLRVVERNARTQAQLIEDLLDMSRIISGKIRLDVQRLNVAEVIESACATIRPAAEAKQITLTRRIDADTAGPIMGDPNRLQQVIWNLLNNAVKFTPAGGRVDVELAPANDHVEIIVSDTGEGIAPEFLLHVFDRFRQADGSTTRRHAGLGLGLSIVKSLVELHGGTIRAESAGRGKGATFYVRLPLATRAASHGAADGHGASLRKGRLAAGAEDSPGVDGQRVPSLSNRPRLDGVRVLVVDDDHDARDLMHRMLEHCGASVLTAADSASALALVRQSRPTIIVSDIGMPGEDGYDLVRRVRALPPAQGGRTPAIALTAFARNEDRRKAIAAGFQVHLAKPVEPAELVTVIASLTQGAPAPATTGS